MQDLEVELANPSKVRIIAESQIKTDKIDARVLAQLLRTNFLLEAETICGEIPNCRLNHRILLKTDNHLYLSIPGQPLYELVPVKTHTFRIKQFADLTFVFVVENGQVKGLKQINPSGEYLLEKKP